MSAETKRLKLEIEMDNSAFYPMWQVEAARILRAAAKKLEDGSDWCSLRDANGNKVGELNTFGV